MKFKAFRDTGTHGDLGIYTEVWIDNTYHHPVYKLKYDLKPGDVVIDAGAQIGSYSLLALSKIGPTGRLFSIEAAATNFNMLKQNVEDYKNATAFNVALWDTDGQTKVFYEHPENQGGHSLFLGTALFPLGGASYSYPVKTATLDSLIPPDLKVNFIKMDIEGAEGHALKGAKRILEARPSIAMEIHNDIPGEPVYQDVVGVLGPLGYEFEPQIGDPHLGSDPTYKRWLCYAKCPR